jgi:hypothetical protein
MKKILFACYRGYLKGPSFSCSLLEISEREGILGFIEALMDSIHHTSEGLGLVITPEAAPESSNESTKTTTGVPNKDYRGPQQGSPYARRPLTPLRPANKPKTRPF